MKLKLNLLSVALLLIGSVTVQGQVGINNKSPKSSLDIQGSSITAPLPNDGLLIPRMDVFPAVNPDANQDGMLIFLNIAVGVKQKGFYYWDNNVSSWIAVSNKSWNLSGNADSNATTNFIGTTNDASLVFKRNNIKAGYLGSSTYDPISFLTPDSNTSFGAGSLLNPTINVGSQRGVRNTVIGANALPSLTTGSSNVAIGNLSMFSSTSGAQNTAVGVGAMFSNKISNGNVAIGRNALTSYVGVAGNDGGHTAIGYSASREVTTGRFNTSLGFEALRKNVTGSGNVGLGYKAGWNELGDNKLYISNSDGDADNALIYGEFDTKIVRVNGALQISNPGTASGYALPTNRGTAAQILTTNGNGATSWETPAAVASTLSAVRVNLSGNQSLTDGGWQKASFDTEVIDTQNEYNTTTQQFVASKAGVFRVNAAYHTNDQNNTQFYSIGIYVNGTLYQETTGNHYNNGLVSRAVNCLVNLAPNDYVEVFVQNYQLSVNLDSSGTKTVFEVVQIR